VFYLDKICSDKPVCLRFQADRIYYVMHAHPVSAKVYDYYEPSEQCTTLYKLTSGSAKLAVICSPGSKNSHDPLCVCGAGRCPKLEKISNRLCSACKHHDYGRYFTILKVCPVHFLGMVNYTGCVFIHFSIAYLIGLVEYFVTYKWESSFQVLEILAIGYCCNFFYNFLTLIYY
jgi:hypothetical protein